jgi:hypothetical protein
MVPQQARRSCWAPGASQTAGASRAKPWASAGVAASGTPDGTGMSAGVSGPANTSRIVNWWRIASAYAAGLPSSSARRSISLATSA